MDWFGSKRFYLLKKGRLCLTDMAAAIHGFKFKMASKFINNNILNAKELGPKKLLPQKWTLTTFDRNSKVADLALLLF